MAQRSQLRVCDKLGANVAQSHYVLKETAQTVSK